MAQHHVVCGLGFGDEGKGTTVDYLAHKYQHEYVVRYNGGAQAAHNVVLPDGRHFCFSQYGSGAFHGTSTFLSRFMVVNPLSMERERQALIKAGARGMGMFIDERALVTTPFHVDLGRRQERERQHGSTGMGVGATMQLAEQGVALRVGECRDPQLLSRRLDEIIEATASPDDAAFKERFMERVLHWSDTVAIVDASFLPREIDSGARCIFEGAQGVLLDPRHGWMPHCTWSNCTAENAEELLAEAKAPRDSYEIIGVLRAWHTRHGAGPLPTEIFGLGTVNPREHNKTHEHQGRFRWGHFDAVLARKALSAAPVDRLAITHFDCTNGGDYFHWAASYDGDLSDVASWSFGEVPWSEAFSRDHQRVMFGKAYRIIRSTGPTWEDKQEIEWSPR